MSEGMLDWEFGARERIRKAYKTARTIAERCAAIRAAYNTILPWILERSAQHPRNWIDPYFLDWEFSPIEYAAWQSIRFHATPLYPQVPVDRFFLDFANPYLKIGLELDGRQWHDVAKDRTRDLQLVAQGWRIFRLTGSETVREPALPPPDWESYPRYSPEWAATERWFMETSDGVIAAIDRVYFRDEPQKWPYFDVCLRTLDLHRIVPFLISPLPEEAWDCEGDIAASWQV